MNSAANRRKSATVTELFAQPRAEQNLALQELTDLAQRFRAAHTRLNDIELELHDIRAGGDRSALLRSLEEARMDYGDARFALSTRDGVSSR